jgi:indole-3-glycerol phosphate synthase
MNILDEIIANKKVEVAELKQSQPIKSLEQSAWFSVPIISLKKSIQDVKTSGIIAEFKRKSPSKGIINASASVERTTKGYVNAGASALSVLTDYKFFGGRNEDLVAARQVNACPILRKDFVIDEYQIVEAKSIGADAILLIAAVLKPVEVHSLTNLAHSLGLEVLLEVHDESELKSNLDSAADLIGVNNRNLKTFEVNIQASKKLGAMIPALAVKVSESGISSINAIVELREYGYSGFLIGENFMKHISPEIAAKEFIQQLEATSKL